MSGTEVQQFPSAVGGSRTSSHRPRQRVEVCTTEQDDDDDVRDHKTARVEMLGFDRLDAIEAGRC